MVGLGLWSRFRLGLALALGSASVLGLRLGSWVLAHFANQHSSTISIPQITFRMSDHGNLMSY